MRFLLFVLLLAGRAVLAQTIEPFVADAGSSSAPTGTLTIANISSPQLNSVGFNVSGTYGGAAVPTGIDWQADCSGSWTALSSPTISGGTWTSTASDVSFAVNGTHSVCVREQSATNINAASNSFTVSNAPATITATNPGTLVVSAGYTQAGTYSGTGYTPAALDWSFDSTACGSAASSPTIGGGNYSFSNTAPGTVGSHTITVCDHSNHAILGTSTSFNVIVAYQGPLDVVAGASVCYAFFACSQAIATGGTTAVIGLTRSSDTRFCTVVATSTGQLASTVSGCSTGGDNGTAISSWCAATTCYAANYPGSNTNFGLPDQSGNSNYIWGNNTTVTTLTASCFSTFYCFANANTGFFANGNQTGSTIVGSVFTIVAWVKPTQLTNGSFYEITGCGAAGHTACPTFRLNGQAGDATAKLELLGSHSFSVAVSTCTISINNWHSVAVTYDGSGNYAFYADGATCGSGTNLKTFTWGTDYPTFLQDDDADYFIGNFRGLIIYKSALSASNTEGIMGTGP